MHAFTFTKTLFEQGFSMVLRKFEQLYLLRECVVLQSCRNYVEVKFVWQISYPPRMVQVRVVINCQKADFSLRAILKYPRAFRCFS